MPPGTQMLVLPCCGNGCLLSRAIRSRNPHCVVSWTFGASGNVQASSGERQLIYLRIRMSARGEGQSTFMAEL